MCIVITCEDIPRHFYCKAQWKRCLVRSLQNCLDCIYFPRVFLHCLSVSPGICGLMFLLFFFHFFFFPKTVLERWHADRSVTKSRPQNQSPGSAFRQEKQNRKKNKNKKIQNLESFSRYTSSFCQWQETAKHLHSSWCSNSEGTDSNLVKAKGMTRPGGLHGFFGGAVLSPGVLWIYVGGAALPLLSSAAGVNFNLTRHRQSTDTR